MMIEKRHSIVAAVIALLLSADCTQERATGPGEPPEPAISTKLPAMELVSDIVQRTTGPLPVQSMLDCEPSEFTVAIPDSILQLFDRIDDVRLSYHVIYSYPRLCEDRPWAEVYDYENHAWLSLTSPGPTDDCHGVPYSGSQLLSAFSVDPEASFFGTKHEIRVRGNIHMIIVEILQYVDDAAWSSVMHHPEEVRPSTMACIGDEIWLVLTRFFCTDERWGEYDSIIVIDSTGHRVSAFEPDVERVYSLVQGDTVIWALTGSPMTISTMDATGATKRQFDVPMSLRQPSASLVWAMDMLWISEPSALKLHAIRVAESIDAGYVISDWGISLGTPLGYSMAVAWDGVHFLVRTGDYLSKRNLSMQTVGQWHLPVASYWGSMYGVQHSEIAWDGEALWTLHYGPRYRPGTAMLLSRFRLGAN